MQDLWIMTEHFMPLRYLDHMYTSVTSVPSMVVGSKLYNCTFVYNVTEAAPLTGYPYTMLQKLSYTHHMVYICLVLCKQLYHLYLSTFHSIEQRSSITVVLYIHIHSMLQQDLHTYNTECEGLT